jgi:hypothetical protein
MLPLALTLPDNVPIIQAVVFHGSPTVPDIGQLRSAARGWIAARVAPTMRAILDQIVRGPLCIEIRPTESVRLPPYLGHCGRPDAGERRRLAGDHAVLIRALEPPGGDRPTLWAAVSAARAIALHLDGALVDLVAQRLVPRWLLTTAVPDPHRFAVMRHILVPASVGPNGLGCSTIPHGSVSPTSSRRPRRRPRPRMPPQGRGSRSALTPSPRGFLDLGPAAASERKRWLRQAVTTLFGDRLQTGQTSRSQPN